MTVSQETRVRAALRQMYQARKQYEDAIKNLTQRDLAFNQAVKELGGSELRVLVLTPEQVEFVSKRYPQAYANFIISVEKVKADLKAANEAIAKLASFADKYTPDGKLKC